MALTVTIPDLRHTERISRNLGIMQGTVAFDSSYPFGGEDIASTLEDKYFKKVTNLTFENTNGYSFEWDQTNQKVKVFSEAPLIVYEEKHTAVANLITLDYPAAWIVNVAQTGQNMAWGKSVAFGSLAANTFCVVGTMADGVRTQIYTDGATDTVYVTYVTQAWAELYACLVQEEVIASLSGAVALANKVMAFGFCELATTGILAALDFDDTTATGEVGIDYGEAAAAALDIAAADAGEAGLVTYLKLPASGFLADRHIKDEDPAKAGADPYTQMFDKPLLLWCITGYVPCTGQATQVLVDAAITPAAGEAIINWWNRAVYDLLATIGTATASSWGIGMKSNLSATAGCYLFGRESEVPKVPLEAKNATDLSNLTAVRWTATGLI